jgi:hypothetical protein
MSTSKAVVTLNNDQLTLDVKLVGDPRGFTVIGNDPERWIDFTVRDVEMAVTVSSSYQQGDNLHVGILSPAVDGGMTVEQHVGHLDEIAELISNRLDVLLGFRSEEEAPLPMPPTE